MRKLTKLKTIIHSESNFLNLNINHKLVVVFMQFFSIKDKNTISVYF